MEIRTVKSSPTLRVYDIHGKANRRPPQRQLGKGLVWIGKEPSGM